ncbi:MAG: lipoprotein-releasing system ATP-binding protein LolD [Flammeovirgaceae bacterium]|nr:lipoprotein-releasing system ATP-binding protein LolD [Flammeovirgaceae bacterium]|tara:strand:+ start:2984 stop:3634 length:651 start_codon:yes stop_codon:yes gene_type:complete
MLHVKDVYKSYGALEVLKGIDLEVAEKEVISIVGASGAGKSTLLHILASLDHPDQGSVKLRGQALFSLSSNKLAKFRNDHIGLIFQFHNLLPEFTALENVCIPGYIGNHDEAEVLKSGIELLDRLGIKERASHKPSELSGGEQHRVAVARALINQPDIIFADEPSGNLDSTNARALHKLFFELRDDLGHTFVIVTHNEELADMADRKLVMRDGLMA